MRSKLLIFLLFYRTVFATDYCVTPAGSGGSPNSGVDWDNSFSYSEFAAEVDKATTEHRGNRFLFSEGTFNTTSSMTFDAGDSGTSTVSIVKATDADHGDVTAAVGWASALGDEVTLFTVDPDNVVYMWYFTSDYWIIDGVNGGGPSDWMGANCGFEFQWVNYTTTSWNQDIFISLADSSSTIGSSNTIIKHCKFTMPDDDDANRDGDDQINGAIAGMSTTNEDDGPTGVTIQYCAFYGSWKQVRARMSDSWVIEYSSFRNNYPGDSQPNQEEAFELFGVDGWTFRFNLFDNIQGTGMIAFKNTSSCYDTDNNEIYGNVFIFTDNTINTNTAAAVSFSNDCAGDQNLQGSNLVYNNAFINYDSTTNYAYPVVAYDPDVANPNYFYNNAIYDSEGTLGVTTSGFTVDYNWTISCGTNYGTWGANHVDEAAGSDPFTDTANYVFTLTRTTTAGTTLGPPYNTDWLGTTRGSDGTWDRSVLELISGITYFIGY